MRSIICSRVVYALALAGAFCAAAPSAAADHLNAAVDAAVDAPPAALAPTTAKLSDVLSAHDKALGSAAAGASKTVVEQWAFTDAGIAGSETLQRSGLDYRSRIVAGPFVEQYGQYRGTRWHQDANGFTAETSQIDARSFYAVRVLEDAADPKNDVKILGQTTAAHPAWVLQISRPGYRHPEWIFYDTSSAQVVRVEFVGSSRRIVETYDDFRTTAGFTQAWHMHDSDGRPELDDDWTLQSVRRGVALPDAVFQMPPHSPTVSHVTAPTEIPDRTTRVGFIVRMTVGGRGLDFLLDSASDESILDRNVARDLNLPTYGQTVKLADGRPVIYRTTIADADVAGIRLHDFTVLCRDFAYNPDSNIRIVGVLGFDFFAANVLHFDFVNGRLEALPSAPFTATAPVAGGIEIPLTIDDGVPLVPVYIGNTLATKVVLDTALSFSLVSGTFAAEHPSDVVDESRGGHAHALVPFADDASYGVTAEMWIAKTPHLRFALSDYLDKTVITGNFPFTLHGRDVDGFIGNDYLRLYDVYFAYPTGRLIVKPNVTMLELERHP